MKKLIGIVVCGLSAIGAQADPVAGQAGQPTNAWELTRTPIVAATAAPVNQYPPGSVVPAYDTRLPDDTIYMEPPAPGLIVRAGNAVYGDNTGANNGAALSAAILLSGGTDGRNSVIFLQGDVAAGQGGFGYAGAAARVRYRTALDANHIAWAGVGLDIGGEGTTNSKLHSYLDVQVPIGLIGVMHPLGNATMDGQPCVFEVFAKGTVAIFDNQVQISSDRRWKANWNNMLRPMLGSDLAARCSSFKVVGDYQHLFSFGPAAAGVKLPGLSTSTDIAKLETSKTWPMNGKGHLNNLGFFVRATVTVEHGDQSAPVGDATRQTRIIGGGFTGLQIGF